MKIILVYCKCVKFVQHNTVMFYVRIPSRVLNLSIFKLLLTSINCNQIYFLSINMFILFLVTHAYTITYP